MPDFFTHLQNVQRFGIRPGLERIRALLHLQVLAPPSFPHILIGGTNGKGSTAQFLAHLLSNHARRRIGLYTSPHLYAWNERIRIIETQQNQGELFPGSITDSQLQAEFETVFPHIQAIESQHGATTEFELLTLLGIAHFAHQKVDAAVVEVGLGGRWDATNALEPNVSVITHVALDHCDRLGDTLELIAADKICIARPNRVLVTAETKSQVLEVFAAHCLEIGARLWSFRALDYSNDASTCSEVWDEVSTLILPDGAGFQRDNLQTARMAYSAFCLENSWPIEDESSATLQVLAGVPGRFEFICQAPKIVVDGANNPDGIAQLVQVLATRKNDWKRVIAVVGVSADKDYETMLQVLGAHCDVLIATQANHPRALDAQTLAEHARKYLQSVEAVSIVPNAIERAREIANIDDLILVTGSFFVLGEVPR